VSDRWKALLLIGVMAGFVVAARELFRLLSAR